MKKLVSIFLGFCVFTANADMAPIAYLPGGTVKPIGNNDIQLYSETIEISLFSEFYAVEVNYIFKNKGKEQKVVMGFPSNQETKVIDFQAYEGFNLFKTKSQPMTLDFGNESKYIDADFSINSINSFECFSVIFKEGETKKIKNTFKQKYTENYGGKRISFFYILKTGSLWKDEINNVVLSVNSNKAPSKFNLNESYLNDKKVSLENFETKYENTEANFNIFFSVALKNDFIVSGASSQLNSTGAFNYSYKNLKDEDHNTAWVEGVKGYGIGEKIYFYSNKGYKYLDKYIVDSIGIINGYAKNELTFRLNSRVRKMKITFSIFDETDSVKSKSIDVELKDSPNIQYIRFKPSFQATHIDFEIREVYKGTKFDDTAISEVFFFVKQ